MVIYISNLIYENLPKGVDGSALTSALNDAAITLSKKIAHFHVVDNDEHKLLRLSFEKSDDNLKVNILEYLNFEEAQKAYKDGPSSMEEFLEYLNRKKLLVLKKNEQPQILLPSLPKPKKAPRIDPLIIYKGVTVKLSRELMNGMNGDRGADHVIPHSMLSACIQKKCRKLKNEINNNARLDFYFNVINATSSQILNLVLSPDPSQNVWHAITAYYMPTSSIKARFNLSDTLFEAWKKNLPSLRLFESLQQ